MKSFKKIMVLIVTLALVLSSITVPVFADENNVSGNILNATAISTEVNVGDTISIKLSTNEASIATFGASVKYDPEYVEYQGFVGNANDGAKVKLAQAEDPTELLTIGVTNNSPYVSLLSTIGVNDIIYAAAENLVTINFTATKKGTAAFVVEEACHATIVVAEPSVTINAVLDSIEVTNAKTSYVIGQSFDTTGMVVTAKYTDNSTDVVTNYTVSPEGALSETDTKVTVSYTEGEVTKTADVDITVSEKTVSSIEVATNPTYTAYHAGDSFQTAGMVVNAVYSDGSKQDVTSSVTITPNAALAAGTTEVKIEYTEGTATVENTVAITVSDHSFLDHKCQAEKYDGTVCGIDEEYITYVVGETETKLYASVIDSVAAEATLTMNGNEKPGVYAKLTDVLTAAGVTEMPTCSVNAITAKDSKLISMSDEIYIWKDGVNYRTAVDGGPGWKWWTGIITIEGFNHVYNAETHLCTNPIADSKTTTTACGAEEEHIKYVAGETETKLYASVIASAASEATLTMNGNPVTADFAKLTDVLTAAGVTVMPTCSVKAVTPKDEKLLAMSDEIYIWKDGTKYRTAVNGGPGWKWWTGIVEIDAYDHVYDAETHLCKNPVADSKTTTKDCGAEEEYIKYVAGEAETKLYASVIESVAAEATLTMNGTEKPGKYAKLTDILTASGVTVMPECSVKAVTAKDEKILAMTDEIYIWKDGANYRTAVNGGPGWKWWTGIVEIDAYDHAFDAETHLCKNPIADSKATTKACGVAEEYITYVVGETETKLYASVIASAASEATLTMNGNPITADFAKLTDVLTAAGVTELPTCSVNAITAKDSKLISMSDEIYIWKDGTNYRTAVDGGPGWKWWTGITTIEGFNHVYNAETHLCTNPVADSKTTTKACGAEEEYIKYVAGEAETKLYASVIASAASEATFTMNGREITADFAKLTDVLTAAGVTEMPTCSVNAITAKDSKLLSMNDEIYIWKEGVNYRTAVNEGPGWKWWTGIVEIDAYDHAYDADTHLCTNPIADSKTTTVACGAEEEYIKYVAGEAETKLYASVIASVASEATFTMNGNPITADFAKLTDVLTAAGVTEMPECSVKAVTPKDEKILAMTDEIYIWKDGANYRTAVNGGYGWKWWTGIVEIDAYDHAYDAETHLCTNPIADSKTTTAACGAEEEHIKYVAGEAETKLYASVIASAASEATLTMNGNPVTADFAKLTDVLTAAGVTELPTCSVNAITAKDSKLISMSDEIYIWKDGTTYRTAVDGGPGWKWWTGIITIEGFNHVYNTETHLCTNPVADSKTTTKACGAEEEYIKYVAGEAETKLYASVIASVASEATLTMNGREITADFAKLTDVLTAAGITEMPECSVKAVTPKDEKILAMTDVVYIWKDGVNYRTAVDGGYGWKWWTGIVEIDAYDHAYDAETHLCTNPIADSKTTTAACGAEEEYIKYVAGEAETKLYASVIASAASEATFTMNGREITAEFAKLTDVLTAAGITEMPECSVKAVTPKDEKILAMTDEIYIWKDGANYRTAVNEGPGWKWWTGIVEIDAYDHAYDAETHLCTNPIADSKTTTAACGAEEEYIKYIAGEAETKLYASVIASAASEATLTMNGREITAEFAKLTDVLTAAGVTEMPECSVKAVTPKDEKILSMTDEIYIWKDGANYRTAVNGGPGWKWWTGIVEIDAYDHVYDAETHLCTNPIADSKTTTAACGAEEEYIKYVVGEEETKLYASVIESVAEEATFTMNGKDMPGNYAKLTDVLTAAGVTEMPECSVKAVTPKDEKILAMTDEIYIYKFGTGYRTAVNGGPGWKWWTGIVEIDAYDHVYDAETHLCTNPIAVSKTTTEDCGAAEPITGPDGLANSPAYDGGWYYFKDNKIATDVTTVAHNNNGWWYVENGKVNFEYTGFASNENGDWYIEKGKVTFKTTDIINGTLNDVSAWWYVVDSKVTYDKETIAHNSNGWWYVGKDGKVDFEYTGFASNANGDWYVVNGKVNFDVDDIIYGEVKGVKAWWYIVKSKVTYGEETVAHNANGWWYVGKDGKVDFTANTVAHNANGWWMVENGKVTFKYNGLGTNANGTWYIKDSKVDFTFNGTYAGKTIKGGKVVG